MPEKIDLQGLLADLPFQLGLLCLNSRIQSWLISIPPHRMADHPGCNDRGVERAGAQAGVGIARQIEDLGKVE